MTTVETAVFNVVSDVPRTALQIADGIIGQPGVSADTDDVRRILAYLFGDGAIRSDGERNPRYSK